MSEIGFNCVNSSVSVFKSGFFHTWCFLVACILSSPKIMDSSGSVLATVQKRFCCNEMSLVAVHLP